MRVVIVGDAMVDIIARPHTRIAQGADVPGQIHDRVGGGALTTARLLAEQGVHTTFLGCVGNDNAGQRILSHIERAGIHSRVHESDALPTGRVLVLVDSDGERTMVSDVGANIEFPTALFDESAATFQGPCHVHFSAYWLTRPSTRDLALSAMRHLKPDCTTLSLGMVPSTLWFPDHIEFVAQATAICDLVFSNEEEAQHAQRAGVSDQSTWVVTYGSRGAAIWPQQPSVTSPPPRNGITDTTGAGDAFTAGFLGHWLTTREDFTGALAQGHEYAARYLSSRVADNS